MTQKQKKLDFSKPNDRFPGMGKYRPVCESCKHCLMLKKDRGNVYMVDCADNPNLGGITGNYKKCPGYVKV